MLQRWKLNLKTNFSVKVTYQNICRNSSNFETTHLQSLKVTTGTLGSYEDWKRRVLSECSQRKVHFIEMRQFWSVNWHHRASAEKKSINYPISILFRSSLRISTSCLPTLRTKFVEWFSTTSKTDLVVLIRCSSCKLLTYFGLQLFRCLRCLKVCFSSENSPNNNLWFFNERYWMPTFWTFKNHTSFYPVWFFLRSPVKIKHSHNAKLSLEVRRDFQQSSQQHVVWLWYLHLQPIFVVLSSSHVPPLVTS